MKLQIIRSLPMYFYPCLSFLFFKQKINCSNNFLIVLVTNICNMKISEAYQGDVNNENWPRFHNLFLW